MKCTGSPAPASLDTPERAALPWRMPPLTRRTFVSTLAGGMLAAPFLAEAQQAARVVRIGILGNLPRTQAQGADLWGAFVQGLGELGYVEGQNLTLEERSSEGRYERLPALAGELVRLKVDAGAVVVLPDGMFLLQRA